MRIRLDDPARIARWVIGVSVLALFVLGAYGGQIMPAWGAGCPKGEACDPAHLRSLVLRAWALHGFVLAALVAGMVAIGRSRPHHPEGDGVTDEHAASPWRHTAWVTGFVAVTTGITAAVLGIAMVLGGLMVGAVVAAWWVGMTVVLDALDRLARPDSDRSGSWWRALAVSTVTVGAVWLVPVAVVGVERRGWSEAFLLCVAMLGAVAGIATLWTRLVAGGPREAPPERRQAVLGAALAATLLLPVGLGTLVDVGSPTRNRAGELVSDLLNPYPAPTTAEPAPTEPAASPSPEASPSPTTPPAATCRVSDLTAEATEWDTALGTRSVALVVTNDGPRCTLTGYPEPRLTADGQPVRLTVARPDHGVDGEPVAAGPVTVDEGGSARVVLWWRAAGTPRAEDEERPEQTFRLVLDRDSWVGKVRSVPVTLADPAPFDLVEGARVRMEPWTASD